VTDDERQELKDELMQADLKLRQKQSFWETPRNITLIVAAAAGIAGVLGFKLGQKEPSFPTTQQFILPPGTTIQIGPGPGK
jgi:hypothetical protein